MVQYYNLSNIGGDGFMQILTNVSVASNYAVGYAFVIICFLLPFIYNYNKGEDPVKTTIAASVFATVMSAMLYLWGIMPSKSIVFLCSTVFAISAAVRWINTRD